jgi:hypothetical protein
MAAVGADFAPEPLDFNDDIDDGISTLAMPGRLAKARGTLRTQPLQLIAWQRVICDEAHSIRNQKTQAARACFALVADARWALTGTPVQNKLDDRGSESCVLYAAHTYALRALFPQFTR